MSITSTLHGLRRAGVVCALAVLAACGDRAVPDRGAIEPAGEHADEAGPAGMEEIVLTAEALKRAGIELDTVETLPGGAVMLAPAEITLNADRMAKVGPRVAGRIAALPVALGQQVVPGMVLATIDGPEIGAVVAAFTAAQAAETLAERTLEREQGLFARKIAAEREVLDARAALARAQADRRAAELRLRALGLDPGRLDESPGTLPVRSPIQGTVIDRQAVLGAPVAPDDVLFTIADLSTLWLIAKVPETVIRDIRLGDAVTVLVDALPDRRFAGRVSYIASVVAPASRTVDVRISVENAGRELRAGMFARARLAARAAAGDPGRPVVPRTAVQTLNGRTVVFVPGEPGHFRIQEVTLGRDLGGDVEVLAGLAEGDRVVVTGSFTLKAEAVRGAVGHPH